jgi:predicted transporter
VSLFGGQHNVVTGEFQIVFYLSLLGTVIFAVLLIIAGAYFKRWRGLRIPKAQLNQLFFAEKP